MPSYTHLRRAMPVLVSHFLLSHAAALQRDHARLDQARDEADALPLGSGAIAGTGYPVDTAALAARLGFSRVVANSMDASSDRDFAATFLYATTLAMVHLSRIAEDLILFTSEEFGFFELADASATGSSMMPQKKNPDPLELVRGKAGRADRPPHGPARHDEGPADRVQQGPAGGQGAALRRRGHARRLGRGDRGRREPSSRSMPSAPGGPPRGCCWPPTSPTTWSRAACRSARPTKWSARWCGSCSPTAATSRRSALAEWQAFSPLFAEDVQGAGHGAGVGPGPADAAVHQPGRRSRSPPGRPPAWLAALLTAERPARIAAGLRL